MKAKLPPAGRAAEVVNDSVILTPVLSATRSAVAIIKDTADEAKTGVGGTPIPPEGTPTDGAVSTSVCTVIPVALPAVAAPIAKPLRTMVRDVAGPTSIPPMVMMIFVGEGKDDVANRPFTGPDAVAKGVPCGTKKSEG